MSNKNIYIYSWPPLDKLDLRKKGGISKSEKALWKMYRENLYSPQDHREYCLCYSSLNFQLGPLLNSYII